MKKLFALLVPLALLAACGRPESGAADLTGAQFVKMQNDVVITLNFDQSENMVSGRIVNNFRGPYEIDGNNISFGAFASTMMMGPENAMNIEQAFFQFMPTVHKFKLTDASLYLFGEDGAFKIFDRVADIAGVCMPEEDCIE